MPDKKCALVFYIGFHTIVTLGSTDYLTRVNCSMISFIDLDQRLSKVGVKGMDIKWGSK